MPVWAHTDLMVNLGSVDSSVIGTTLDYVEEKGEDDETFKP